MDIIGVFKKEVERSNEMLSRKERIELDAKAIAVILCKTDTDYRGNLLDEISRALNKNTQGYTARIFKTMARVYGLHDYV